MKKQKTDSIRNRVFSFISAAIIGLNSIPMMSFTTANAASSASNSSSVQFPTATSDAVSAKLNHDDTLVDNGDGTFTFTSKITSDYSYSDLSESRMQFKDGYYKLDKVGKYLIELWGGDGGDGGRALFSGRSGVGGSGGFVYGILEVTNTNDLLNKYLVYEIGSKGESTTFDVNGGGTAGDGGGAGNITFVSIGAGGGYSAVYLSDNETICNNEDKNAKSSAGDIKFRDDPQNVLMIAGGGGGGAAGANGAHLTALFLKMHGDGGDGGSEKSSITGPVSLEESNLCDKGTYYAGENGTSSGGQTRYVGQGGTDRPEGHATTFLGGMEASTYANDWQMIYHPDLGRGVGGAGNLHGGGGGAGLAGGGGGIQNVIVDANNVGGGGGGSSFISNQFSEFTAFAKPTDTSYFVDKEGNTNKETGGAIVIRYLPPANNYNYLNGVEISGEVSEYFDIVSASCFESKTNNSSDVKPASGNTITFSGSVAPVQSGLEMGQENDSLTLTLRLKPKAAFAGGNNVPIFKVESGKSTFECKSTVDATKTCDIDYSDTYTAGDNLSEQQKQSNKTYEVSHVNVPLNLDLRVNNLIKSPTENYVPTDLYEVGADSPKALISNAPNGFITVVGTPTVDGFTGESITLTDQDLNKTNTHKITVGVTLSNTGDHAVGEPCKTSFERTATVKCIDAGTIFVDGFEIKPKKTLSYDSTSGNYVFDLDLNIKRKDDTIFNHDVYYLKALSQAQKSEQNNSPSNSFAQISPTDYTVQSDGWFYLQAWGGNGGTGGDFSSYLGHDPGTGGTGGYVAGYVYLTKGQIVSCKVGSYGKDGNTGTNRTGGYGGAYSELLIDSETVMIAGGGAGGNAIYRSWYGDSDYGANGADAGTNYSATLSSDRNVYKGSNGIVPEKKPDAANTDNVSQPAGQNYLNTTLVNAGDKTIINSFGDTIVIPAPGSDVINAISDSKGSITGGKIVITRFEKTTEDQTGEKASLESRLSGFVLDEDFSQYFDVQDILINDVSINSTDTSNIVFDIKDIVQYSDTFTEYSGYKSDYYSKGDISALISGGINKKITVKLKPKTNFLGGNDVPLLDKTINEPTSGSTTAVKIYHTNTTDDGGVDDNGYVAKLPETDYANVEIDSSGVVWNVPSYDVYVPCGTTVDLTGYSVSDPTESSSDTTYWEDDYLENPIVTSCNPSVQPITQDTSYTLKATLSPKYPNDTDHTSLSAVVREQMSAKNTSVVINAHVLYRLTQNLTGLSSDKVIPDKNYDDEFTIDDVKDNYVVELTANSGYNVTNDSNTTVTVTINGEDKTAQATISRDTDNGKITVSIPKERITGNITITASAAELPHKVYYFFETYDPISGPTQGILNSQVVEEYSSGATIAASANIESKQNSIYTPPSDMPEPYTSYEWTWSIETNANGDYVMGNSDVYVFGAFKQPTATLRINYVSSNQPDATFDEQIGSRTPYISGDPRTDPYGIPLTVGSTYYVTSPDVDGYYTNTPVISGTVEDIGNIEKNVRYYQTTESLIIYLIQCGKNGIPSGESTHVFRKDEVNTSVPSGYHIFDVTQYKKDTSSYYEESIGSVDNIGNSGTYYVYYRQDYEATDLIPITFHCTPPADGLTVSPSGPLTRTVVIGREYSYNKDPDGTEDFSYNGMPTVRCSNYTFLGWADSAGNFVNDEDIVTAESPTELYAQWESAYITISVDYKYAYTINTNVVPSKTPGADIGSDEFETGTVLVPGKSIRKGMAYKIGTASKIDNAENNIIVPEHLKDDSYSTDTYISEVALAPKTHEVLYSNNTVTPTDIKLTVNVYSETYKNTDGSVKSGSPKLTGGTFVIYDINGTQIGSVKSNSDGSVSWDVSDSSITTNGKYKVVCTDPPTGYGTAEITVTLDANSQTGTNQYTTNIFLDKSPFQLPFAGSKPLTGYTVCGISTMLLAAFLLFLYVSSKAEENENE